MTVARVGVHALVVLVLLHMLFGLARLFAWPAIVGILEFASAGWFVWLALATSAAMNNSRASLIAVLLAAVLTRWPYPTMDTFARTVAPIGLGTLIGLGVRAAARELGGRDAASESLRHDDRAG
jgi:uncharacterized membrane protein